MKNKSSRLLVISFVFVLLTGCSATGNQILKNETMDTISEKIQVGVTTKQEIIGYLGSPWQTSFTDGGLEILTYEYTRFTPRVRNFIPYNFFSWVDDGTKKELVILLDENGIIRNMVMNESELQRRSGLFE